MKIFAIQVWRIVLVLISIISIQEGLTKEIAEKNVPLSMSADSACWDRKGSITTLHGNVHVMQGDMEIFASTMRAYGALEKIVNVEAEGDVKFIDKGALWYITGGYLRYNLETEYLIVSKKPEFSSRKHNIVVRADKLERIIGDRDYFYRGNATKQGRTDKNSTYPQLFIASGKVVITYEKAYATGTMATYYVDDEKIILVGNPEIIRDGNKFSAEKILFYLKEEKIEFVGRVKGAFK